MLDEVPGVGAGCVSLEVVDEGADCGSDEITEDGVDCVSDEGSDEGAHGVPGDHLDEHADRVVVLVLRVAAALAAPRLRFSMMTLRCSSHIWTSLQGSSTFWATSLMKPSLITGSVLC